MLNRGLKGSQANCQLSTCRVAGDAKAFQIEPRERVLLVSIEQAIRAAKVFKSTRPSTASIAHTTVLYVPACDAGLLQCIAEMAGISEIIFRAPIAAMNEENNWMGPFSRGQAHVDKLVFILSVLKPQIGIRWLQG